MKKSLWLLGLIVVVTIIYGTIYVVAQQALRMGANDPQIQLAEDMAVQFSGKSPSMLNSAPKTDIAASLSPFLMFYNNDRQLTAGNAILEGHDPVLPPGVLSNTTVGHENRLTWQPRARVRIAAVVVKYNDGYVLAGRSLREVEKRETSALNQTMIGWLVTVGFLLGCAWLAPAKPKHG